MTTDRVVVQDAARRPSVDHNACECTWHDAPNSSVYGHSGATEDGRGKARRRSLRWMELGWEGTTTAAREEARKEAVLEMLRERRDQEAERLKRLRAEVQVPHEVARL